MRFVLSIPFGLIAAFLYYLAMGFAVVADFVAGPRGKGWWIE